MIENELLVGAEEAPVSQEAPPPSPNRKRRGGFRGDRMRAQRRKLGMRVEILARRLRCTEAAIYWWELGRREPDVKRIRAIERALRLEKGDLIR